MDDIIKSRGEKVAPKEVETALVDDARACKEAAVVGVPDEILGQAPKAFVVLEPGARLGEKELQRECQRKLESFMVPQVRRARRRSPEDEHRQDQEDGARVRRQTMTIQDDVKHFITENFYLADPSKLRDETSLVDEGIVDSTGVLEVVAFLEETFAIKIADADLVPENLDSIARITAFVARKKAA